jgi:hypothetical protein
MAYKVFLFDNTTWLYCEDVTFEDGVYHGEVINGGWHLMYDTKLEGWFACHSREAANSLVAVTKGHKKLTWACDPYKPIFDYNKVIEEAKERYKAGEPANFELKEEHVIEYDDVPF